MPQTNLRVAHRLSKPLLADSRNVKRPLETDDCQERPGAKRVRGTSFARSKQGLNPAFCNPTLRGVKDVAGTTTPAPQKEVILVPRTTTPTHGRTRSSNIETLSAPASYGQTSPELLEAIDETSFELQHHSTPESLVVQQLDGESSASGSLSSPTTCKFSQGLGYARHKISSSQGSTELLSKSYSSVPGSRLAVGTCPPSASSSHDSGQVSPRPHSRVSVTGNLGEKSSCTRRAVLGPISSPPEPTIESSQHTTTTSPQTLLTMVTSLPREVRPPTPVMSQASHRPVLAEGLSKLGVDYDLTRQFRPCLVKRRVWKKERGYWKLCILIRPKAMVEYVRQAPLTLSQQRDCKFVLIQEGRLPAWVSTEDAIRSDTKACLGGADVDRHTLWTVGEFTQFWQSTERIISQGRAGRFVRALLNTVETEEDGIRVEVRLYCNADVLAHVWLMLVGLSSGIVKKMPLEWYGHDSQTVLCMPASGRGGSADLWSEGRDGTWGPGRTDDTRSSALI